ncbi:MULTISPECIES: DUF1684 domain-containing protein [Streptomyces]|uniref:Uncharacterized protein n=1 Tax=Streptomyces harbinensis TaxID=1176198 RepID=A0A1I6US34_9ACTN|nr:MULTISPECIES: DUF1684 domain-containing protein [Streptomyces]QKV69185.1 DUF1684 domain-containing protein [Streptomyces harbinensis]SFT04261.1 hypothetical protein SAMN05444716_106132 [Streptomyces harbinensis]
MPNPTLPPNPPHPDPGSGSDPEAFVRDWTTWRRARERSLAAPHGFLAITSMRWLTPEPTRFDDAPGAWSTGDDGAVLVTLADGETLTVDGEPVHGRHRFDALADGGSVFPVSGDLVIEVARRGGQALLRPRDPANPLRTGFTGTPVFAPDPAWARPGRFLPFDAPRPVTVGAVVEGLEHVLEAPGQVEFELDGAAHRLTAFNGGRPGALSVLFTDATSGVSTYAANRSLSIEPPDAEGRVTVDFNRAVNLPCAYTDLATCPLPPRENRLAPAVEAGERLPLERGGRP